MRKFLRIVLAVMPLAIATPALSEAAIPPNSTSHDQLRASQLQQRMEEIRGMDINSLTRSEKKALRGEVRAIKKEMAEISGGVYLSVGAIILIVLLILLLA